MSKKIIAFNLVYYAVTLFFVRLGQNDPSSSLGYGYFILWFWIFAGIALIVMLRTKVLQPKTIADRIGILTATPVPTIIAVQSLFSLQ
jgi:hypothetical protein